MGSVAENFADIKTFNRDSWYGWAGCTQWPGEFWANEAEKVLNPAVQPITREIGDWLVIADAVSVWAYGMPDEDDGFSQFLGMVVADRSDAALLFPNQMMARYFLAGLPDDFDPSVASSGWTKQ